MTRLTGSDRGESEGSMRGRLALVGAGATGTSISVSMMFTRYSYSVLLVVLGRGFCSRNSKGGHILMCFDSG